jgi:hypothetical protein
MADKKKVFISAYVPASLKREVEKQAELEERSVSATVGRAIRDYLMLVETNTQGGYDDRVQAGSWREYE